VTIASIPRSPKPTTGATGLGCYYDKYQGAKFPIKETATFCDLFQLPCNLHIFLPTERKEAIFHKTLIIYPFSN